MNHDDYTSKLAQYLDPQARERILGADAPAVALPDAPLGNFFGDDFFTLLYRSNDPSTYPLDGIKEQPGHASPKPTQSSIDSGSLAASLARRKTAAALTRQLVKSCASMKLNGMWRTIASTPEYL